MLQRDCLIGHLGLWLIEPQAGREILAQVQAGVYPEISAATAREKQEERGEVTRYGIAVIPLLGMLRKGFSKFGGTSTIFARRQIRAAARDEEVRGIFLPIDSPGGLVAGSFELAEDIRRAGETKPVRAHIQDLGASAAYFAASQAGHITINAPGETGSIGTIALLTDSSGAAELQGLKVHVVSTGPLKGAFAPGTEITEAQLAYAQRRVDFSFRFFRDAVARGRGLEGARLEAVTDGRVLGADEALALGLVDEITDMDTSMEAFVEELAEKPRQASRLAEVRRDLVAADLAT